MDVEFWKSIYHFRGGSGIDWITGWINILYPYELVKNNVYQQRELHDMNDLSNKTGVYPHNIPNGLNKTPLIWKYYGRDIPMKIYSGFTYPKLNDDRSVEPDLFWAMIQCPEESID